MKTTNNQRLERIFFLSLLFSLTSLFIMGFPCCNPPSIITPESGTTISIEAGYGISIPIQVSDRDLPRGDTLTFTASISPEDPCVTLTLTYEEVSGSVQNATLDIFVSNLSACLPCEERARTIHIEVKDSCGNIDVVELLLHISCPCDNFPSFITPSDGSLFEIEAYSITSLNIQVSDLDLPLGDLLTFSAELGVPDPEIFLDWLIEPPVGTRQNATLSIIAQGCEERERPLYIKVIDRCGNTSQIKIILHITCPSCLHSPTFILPHDGDEVTLISGSHEVIPIQVEDLDLPLGDSLTFNVWTDIPDPSVTLTLTPETPSGTLQDAILDIFVEEEPCENRSLSLYINVKDGCGKSYTIKLALHIICRDIAHSFCNEITYQIRVDTIGGIGGVSGLIDGPTSLATITQVEGIALDQLERIYFTQRTSGDDYIRILEPEPSSGIPWIHTAYTIIRGECLPIKFNVLYGITVSRDGNVIYVADPGDRKIYKLKRVGGYCFGFETWVKETFAGTGEDSTGEGPALTTPIHGPTDLALADDETLFFLDINSPRVPTDEVKMIRGGVISIIADSSDGINIFYGGIDTTPEGDYIFVANSIDKKILEIRNTGSGWVVNPLMGGGTSIPDFTTSYCGDTLGFAGAYLGGIKYNRNHQLFILGIENGAYTYLLNREGCGIKLAGTTPSYSDGLATMPTLWSTEAVAWGKDDSFGRVAYVANDDSYQIKKIHCVP